MAKITHPSSSPERRGRKFPTREQESRPHIARRTSRPTFLAPQDLSNHEIGARTGVRPHTQVFIIARDLMQAGLIKGLQSANVYSQLRCQCAS